MNGFNAGSSGNGSGSASGGSNSNNNANNNYVNFNQFIIQHNLAGGAGIASYAPTSGQNTTTTTANTTRLMSETSATAANTIDYGEQFYNFGLTTHGDKSPNMAEHFQQQQSTNCFNPNSNLFPTAMMMCTNGGTNGSSYQNTTSLSFYDNFYTPFGNSGTTYYVNPFAAGFDFNAAASSSTLHATAPEFVPRFGNLTLNEVACKSSPPGSITNGSANFVEHTTITKAAATPAPTPTPTSITIPIGLNTMMRETTAGQLQYDSCESHDITSQINQNLAPSTNTNAAVASPIADNTEHATNLSLATRDNKTMAEKKSSMPAMLNTSNPRSSTIVLRNVESISGSNSSSSSSPTSSMSKSAASTGGKAAIAVNTRTNYNNNNNTTTTTTSAISNGFLAPNPIVDSRTMPMSATATLPAVTASPSSRRPSDYPYQERDRDRDELRERGERNERGHGHMHRKNRERDYHQRYENHRNKRWDDHNRNRDRINGFRDTIATEGDGKDSPLPSPEKKPSPKKYYPENEKLSQREKLIRDIETRRLECLVCVEAIKGQQPVWSCHNCFHILHLQCIIKWASSSKSDDGWRCPACQNVAKEVPRHYYCFCGKLKNPPYNRQDIAHSCGELCGRVEGCPHACTLLCHPGPCPPCQANVRRECGCGKTTRSLQCCIKEPVVCDATCGKLLNCEVHTCAATCHDGKCAPCAQKVDQRCHCSKQERQVACTRDSHDKHTYSCGKPCSRDLACGNHKCKDCCHAGECRPCKLSPAVVTSCPCGKLPVLEEQRSSCLDAIPTCQGTCGKTLRCGKVAHPHQCASKCHLGNCPPCNKQTAVKCRCGHMDQLIKCRQLSTRADDARCKKRCTKKRSCGKHKCNQECCIDIDHICPLPCNYTLSCGRHKCDQPCHRGNCSPCYRSSFEELYCECGAEVIYPPVACGTKRPQCKRPCTRSHPCDHPPQHNCHSAATCPPCMILTTQWCYGNHEQRKTIPCSQQSFSCGLACQKPLSCGRHKCIKTCHTDVCQSVGEVCKQSCTSLRASCGHKCMAPCHDGDCPDTPCKEMVEVQCECGNRKQMRSCAELAREFSRIATAQLASSMAEMQRGNYMELSEILAPVKINKTNKTLDCNDECRLLERNRRLAIGLQIRNPELQQKLQTKYTEFTRNFAKRDPAIVKSIHDALTTLVKLAKESKQKSRSHSFPTMNREKRQLVHEMCEMFGVESVAYDAEPNRNVVATAYKNRSWLPATSVMEVVQREAGQRRVPVPSNNAWGLKR